MEKPLLHTWSLAVEEQFYLALPLLLWGLSRITRKGRIALPVILGALALASFVLSIWLMKSDRSANAFFMSPPRAWEFLIGGLIATPGLPVLRHALAQQIARGVALVVIAIPIFALRQGPGFPVSMRWRRASVPPCSCGAASAFQRRREAGIRRSTL